MVCPQWILKLISSYVGIIQIRFMGRSWLLPLSLPTSSPVIIIKFSFFSVSISTLQSIFYNLLANNSTNYFILFINSMLNYLFYYCYSFRFFFYFSIFRYPNVFIITMFLFSPYFSMSNVLCVESSSTEVCQFMAVLYFLWHYFLKKV